MMQTHLRTAWELSGVTHLPVDEILCNKGKGQWESPIDAVRKNNLGEENHTYFQYGSGQDTRQILISENFKASLGRCVRGEDGRMLEARGRGNGGGVTGVRNKRKSSREERKHRGWERNIFFRKISCVYHFLVTSLFEAQ